MRLYALFQVRRGRPDRSPFATSFCLSPNRRSISNLSIAPTCEPCLCQMAESDLGRPRVTGLVVKVRFYTDCTGILPCAPQSGAVKVLCRIMIAVVSQDTWCASAMKCRSWWRRRPNICTKAAPLRPRRNRHNTTTSASASQAASGHSSNWAVTILNVLPVRAILLRS